jgi:hypothetical protein
VGTAFVEDDDALSGQGFRLFTPGLARNFIPFARANCRFF